MGKRALNVSVFISLVLPCDYKVNPAVEL